MCDNSIRLTMDLSTFDDFCDRYRSESRSCSLSKTEMLEKAFNGKISVFKDDGNYVYIGWDHSKGESQIVSNILLNMHDDEHCAFEYVRMSNEVIDDCEIFEGKGYLAPPINMIAICHIVHCFDDSDNEKIQEIVDNNNSNDKDKDNDLEMPL